VKGKQRKKRKKKRGDEPFTSRCLGDKKRILAKLDERQQRGGGGKGLWNTVVPPGLTKKGKGEKQEPGHTGRNDFALKSM